MKHFWRFTAYISGRQYFNPFLRGFRIPIPDYPQPASQPTNQPAFNLASQPAIQPAIEPGSQPGSGEKRSEKLSEKQSEFFTKRNATKKNSLRFSPKFSLSFFTQPLGDLDSVLLNLHEIGSPWPSSHLPTFPGSQPASSQAFQAAIWLASPSPSPSSSQGASQPANPPARHPAKQAASARIRFYEVLSKIHSGHPGDVTYGSHLSLYFAAEEQG